MAICCPRMLGENLTPDDQQFLCQWALSIRDSDGSSAINQFLEPLIYLQMECGGAYHALLTDELVKDMELWNKIGKWLWGDEWEKKDKPPFGRIE